MGGWGVGEGEGRQICVVGTPMGSGNHVTSPHIATEALTYMPPPPPARVVRWKTTSIDATYGPDVPIRSNLRPKKKQRSTSFIMHGENH